jgi:hypothetical protein
MSRSTLLVVLTSTGSALCWWPFFMIQTAGRSHLWFLPYPLIALLAGYATSLSGGRWLRFVVLSSAGTFVGVCSGGAIWPAKDGIAQSYLFYGAGIATLVTALLSSLSCFVGRRLSSR